MSGEDWVGKLLRRNPRYAREAYEFVNEALRAAHVRAGREGHVTGRELLAAFRDLAREEFGPLARTVVESWNVRTTEDVGHIVFLCVEAGEMGKTDEDSLDDFRAAFDFHEAFPDDPGEVLLPRPPAEDADDPDDDESDD